MASRAPDGSAILGGYRTCRDQGLRGAGRGTGVNVRTFARMLFNVNEVGPNVNGVILLGGLFVNVSVFNTLTLLVD